MGALPDESGAYPFQQMKHSIVRQMKARMKSRHSFVFLLALGVAFLVSRSVVAAAPTINVWYGLNQTFGQIGNPQSAINILGNVSDPNGISSLTYTLNSGTPIILSRGPDTRRLLSTGDFNIDINTSSLNNGSNAVVITATNSVNETSTATVNIQYTAGQTWPTTYLVDWSAAGSIQSVAQVVDGHWTLSGGAIHPTSLGYDRLVAIGAKTWSEYEATVSITIHGIDPVGGFGYPSNGPGVGMIFRWTGHTDTPFFYAQPKTGYLPLGAIGWYNWDCCDRNAAPRLRLIGNDLNTLGDAGIALTFDVAYYFKMRVQTIPGVGGQYKFKVWQAGQTEPSTWTVQGQQSLSDPQNGSLLLVSHHVDADFGNVLVTPLPPLPIQLSSFTATVQSNNLVLLRWTTISETNNYGFEVQKSLGNANNFQTVQNSFVRGYGTTLEPHQYSFVDTSTTVGHWFYRLKQIDLDGTITFLEPVRVNVLTRVAEKTIPNAFALEQNYPNPFNPSTEIRFQISEVSHVTLKVYDILGREVSTLVNEELDAGTYERLFDATGLASGVFSYRLEAGSFVQARKMIVLK